MSDEEKVIEKFKNFIYTYQEVSEKILNLIEKQQKEIEELKANKGYHLGFIDGGIAKRYEYEDKIKSKIEELDNPLSETFKSLLNAEEPTWSGTIKKFLQSLLEEEIK
jgi:hypothetical protein